MAAEQLDVKTLVTRRPGVISERLLEETVLLDPGTDLYARLNPSGRWLWEQLAEPQTMEALAAALASRFDVDDARALADVSAFVRDLTARRLVDLGP